jgi:hypothetical protein
MRRWITRLTVAVFILVSLLAGAAVVALFHDSTLTQYTIPWLRSSVGLALEADHVTHDVSGTLTAQNLRLDLNGTVLISAKKFVATYVPFDLLSGTLSISSGSIEGGRVVVNTDLSKDEKRAQEEENSDEGAFPMSLREIHLSRFSFELIQGGRSTVTVHDTDATVTSYSSGGSLKGSLRGKVRYGDRGFEIASDSPLTASVSGKINQFGVPDTIAWDLNSEQVVVHHPSLRSDLPPVGLASKGHLILPTNRKLLELSFKDLVLEHGDLPFFETSANLKLSSSPKYAVSLKQLNLKAFEGVYGEIPFIHEGQLAGALDITQQKNTLKVQGSLTCTACKAHSHSPSASDIGVKTTVEKVDSLLKISETTLSQKHTQATLLDVDITGSYSLPFGSPDSALYLVFRDFAVEKVVAEFSPTPPLPPSSPPVIEATIKEKETHPQVPDITLALQVDTGTLEFKGYSIATLSSSLMIQPEAAEIRSLNLKTGKGTLSARGRYHETNGLELLIVDGNSLPFITLYEGDTSKLGTIPVLKIDLQRKASEEDGTKVGLTGSVSAQITNVNLPTKVQQVPPFNLFFLPFQIVQQIGSYVGETILPEIFVETSDDIAQKLSEQGRVSLRKGELDLTFVTDTINIEKAKFRTDILPTITMSGDIEDYSDLALVIRTDIAGLLLPITVGGTLNRPRPDLLNLAPELIKSLGASTINIATKPFQIVEGIVESLESETPPEEAEALSKERGLEEKR